ncbi:MAG: PRC-barrel domain-containing protein [Nitrospinales bacterium]
MRKSPLLYIKENTSDLLMDEQIIGHYVYDMFDENLGRVQGLLVERSSYFPRYLVYIQGGVLGTSGKTILVPREMFQSPEFGKIQISKSFEWIKNIPSPDDLEELTVEEEELILDYFELPVYWDEVPNDDAPETALP